MNEQEYPDALNDLILQAEAKKKESLSRLTSPLFKYPLDKKKKKSPINLKSLPHFIASEVIKNIDSYIKKINLAQRFPSTGDVGKIKVLEDIYSKMNKFFESLEVMRSEADTGIGLIMKIHNNYPKYTASNSTYLDEILTIFVDELYLVEELKKCVLAEKSKMDRWQPSIFKTGDDIVVSRHYDEPFWISILIIEGYIRKNENDQLIWIAHKNTFTDVYETLNLPMTIKNFCMFFKDSNNKPIDPESIKNNYQPLDNDKKGKLKSHLEKIKKR